MANKKNKVRVEFRKNRTKPPRGNDLTRSYQEDATRAGEATSGERVRAKGDISRHRTIIQDDSASGPEAGEEIRGRVLRTHGLQSVVEADDGRVFRCAIRRVLKSLATDERNAVTTGDVVWFRPSSGVRGKGSGVSENPEGTNKTAESADSDSSLTHHPSPLTPSSAGVGENPELTDKTAESADSDSLLTPNPLPLTPTAEPLTPTAEPLTPSAEPLTPDPEGVIERVEPRRGVLTRASRRREHVLVANVDHLVIVVSLVEPDLKPHLIDRYLAAARQGGLAPILCLNKADRVDPVGLQPLVGSYAQLGVPTLLTSARTGVGIGRLRELLRGRATVFSGQSGVGKSSLLNAIQPGLALAVKSVSEVNQKGRHTTTYAQLIRLATGGWVVDTPGVRQLALWDTRPEEVEGYFSEFRPFVSLCGFPDCSHTHETGCAVKAAVARRQISDRRYHSYLGMFRGGE